MRIGIDLMGGDHPPKLLYPALLQIAKHFSSSQSLLVIGTKDVADQLDSFFHSSLDQNIQDRIAIEICKETVDMTDDPLSAVRLKKNSSMAIGMRLLKTKAIDAFITCGNTGALIASAAIILPMFPNLSHPALLISLPTETGMVAVLDAGGNIFNHAEDLVQFAFLGASYQRILRGIEMPKVGLLNIGVESRKGTVEVRKAYGMLERYCQEVTLKGDPLPFHFSGNIEGRDLFKGTVDVLVTDGFTGNVLLKTAEGVAAFIFESLQANIKGEFAGDCAQAFVELKKQFNYTEYPGAILCGVEGLVVKLHGNATAESLYKSILNTVECLEKQLINRLRTCLKSSIG